MNDDARKALDWLEAWVRDSLTAPARSRLAILRTAVDELERRRQFNRDDAHDCMAVEDAYATERHAREAAEDRIAKLEAEIAKWRRHQANIDEALNSGDGTYKP